MAPAVRRDTVHHSREGVAMGAQDAAGKQRETKCPTSRLLALSLWSDAAYVQAWSSLLSLNFSEHIFTDMPSFVS